MQSIAAALLTIAFIIPTPGHAATVLPEKTKQAIAEWNPSFTAEQRADLAKRYGPLDGNALKNIEYYGEDLQGTGNNTEALHHFEFCFEFGKDYDDYLWTSICEQLMAGTERLQGKYVEAEKHYRDALARSQRPELARRVPFILSNLGGIYVAQARYGEALELLDQAEAINATSNTPDPATMQNRAIVYGLQGDLARSLEYFLKALRLYEKKGDERKIALAHYNVGILQIKQGNYEAAAQELEIALALGEKIGDRNRTSQALSDLGRLRDMQGRPKDALALMTRAATMSKEIGLKSGYGENLVNLADFHQAHGELSTARSLFEEALRIFDDLHDGNDQGLALRGLGLVALRQGRIAEAVQYASRAIQTAQQIGDMQGEWQAEALAGMGTRAAGDVREARNHFLRAIGIIEIQRGMVAGGEVEKQRFFEQGVYPYQELALLEATEGGFPALQAADRARARVLLDLVESGPDQLARFFTDEERSEENRFRASISGLNALISKASQTGVTTLVKERDKTWQEYQTFLAGVYVRSPELRNWRGASPALREADLAAVLSSSDTAVIEYLSAREETVVFLASRGADSAHPVIRTVRIPIGRDELKKRGARLRMLLESRDPGYRNEARSLYKLLVAPVAGGDFHQKKRIWMIPDGPLWEVPFQALIDDAGHYWIEDASIAFAPSLTFLREKARASAKPATFSRDLVAFADPARVDFPSVPGLRDQVRQISAYYDPARTDMKVGAEAAEKSFRENAPTARVLHVAAHGIMDQNNALHSRILLSGNGADDGWIEAWELMRMGISADLAVLSACETGRGQVADGEGLVGLTWALFISGVRNTVVSQWRVESASASALMVGLHKRVRQGQRPAEALRGSVLELMKNERYRHPMYWAAFVSVGMDSPLSK